MKRFLQIAEKIVDFALHSDFKNFEDAIQYFSAIENNQEVIITRNITDFEEKIIPEITAGEFVK